MCSFCSLTVVYEKLISNCVQGHRHTPVKVLVFIGNVSLHSLLRLV